MRSPTVDNINNCKAFIYIYIFMTYPSKYRINKGANINDTINFDVIHGFKLSSSEAYDIPGCYFSEPLLRTAFNNMINFSDLQ